MKRIAIQGIKGSNHYLVAQNYFGSDIELHEFLSFDQLVDCLIAENCDYGIMALENTIAGSIIPNYALIDHNELTICGEFYQNIHHHLMALPRSVFGGDTRSVLTSDGIIAVQAVF